MRTLLAISPHLDDAAFSCGGTLAQRARQGWLVIVATCFTANVAHPAGFALACQLDKGLDPSVDYMALRRLEDQAACAALGAKAVHLPFLEAPHRGYESAPALFGRLHIDDDVQGKLEAALVELIDATCPDVVLGPLGLGSHVDHLVVAAALGAIEPGVRLQRWEDWPYVDRQGQDALRDRAHIVVDLTDADIDNKITASTAYQSQIGFQFGSADVMASRLRSRRHERFVVSPALR